MGTKGSETWFMMSMTFIGRIKIINFGETKQKFFSEYKGKAPFIGFFMVMTPYYMLLDPGLVKQVLIQKFKNFRNNDFTVSVEIQKLIIQEIILVYLYRRRKKETH